MERYRPGLSDLQTLDSGSQASMLKVDSLAYEWFCSIYVNDGRSSENSQRCVL
jgi:hypothetical protein